MLLFFNALWGARGRTAQTQSARSAILRHSRREWRWARPICAPTPGVTDRGFTRALDELQAAMLVVPGEVLYRPKFTYLWTLGVGRFPDELRRRVKRETALREIARCFLAGAAMTARGELAKVTGLSRPDAGLGNQALVAEGFAVSPAMGVYRLAAQEPAGDDEVVETDQSVLEDA